jgi:predicted O-linked N-acetylglucosamine transferase (SPINDLY family)
MTNVTRENGLFETARQRFLEGLSAMQAHNWTQAEAALKQSLACVPDRISTLVNLSATLLKLKKQDEAAVVLAKILSLDECNAEALLNQGLLFFQQKQFALALARFDSLIAVHPANLEARVNRAMALAALERENEAIAELDPVIEMAPDNTPAHAARASVLCQMGRWDAALSSADQVLRLAPGDAQTHLARGHVLFGLKQFEQALASYEKAAALRRHFAEAHHHGAAALLSLNRRQAALEHCNQALSIDPDYVEALVQRGRVLEQMGNIALAQADYARVVELDAEYAPVYIAQGDLYRKIKQLDLAIGAYEKAHAIAPLTPFLKGKLLHARMLGCDWAGLNDLRSAIDQAVESGKAVVDPFAYQAIAASEALLSACAGIFTRHWFPARTRGMADPGRNAKIHIGYVCGEFREQATSFLMTRVYELHDKSRFKILAFDNGYDDGSDLRHRIRNAFDEMIDISRLSDAEACAEIQKRAVDILINLNGFFGLARPGVFALRPSPIQVNYLGFPGTLGAPYMDYLLADETVIPLPSQCHYAEKVVYLPHCYQANDALRVIAPQPFSRSACGLPEAGFVFCCFNNNYKITPETFDGWMRILKQVAGSVLWLFENNPLAARNLRAEASRRGVNAERLVFAADLPLPEHLARHALADLFLDTLPYNAHTTASDCLWAGLPLLTCTGTSFPGRVASSLLKALDLPALITDSQQAYEDKAVWLARHPAELRLLRQQLANHRNQCPLFDSARFTHHLELAYTTMIKRYQARLAPEGFSVPMKSWPIGPVIRTRS